MIKIGIRLMTTPFCLMTTPIRLMTTPAILAKHQLMRVFYQN